MCRFCVIFRKLISTALFSICSFSPLQSYDEKRIRGYVLDEPYTVVCHSVHETRFLTKSFWGANPGKALLKILRPVFAGFEKKQGTDAIKQTVKQNALHDISTTTHANKLPAISPCSQWKDESNELSGGLFPYRRQKSQRFLAFLEWILFVFKNTPHP